MKNIFNKTIVSAFGKPNNRNVEGYLNRLEEMADEGYEGYGGGGRKVVSRQRSAAPAGMVKRSSVTNQRFVHKPDVRWKSGVQALIDLVVTRVGISIPIDLPFALMGYTHLASQFFGMLTPPPGLTFSVDVSNPQFIDFVWTNGVNTDRVRVSTTQNNYIAFLQGLASDMFEVEKIRLTLSDVVNTDQFNRSMELGEKTMFGKRTFTPIPVQSLKSPYQQQINIVDLGTDQKPLKWGVDKNVVLISQIKPIDAFSITYSTFISNLDRVQYSQL